MAMFNLTECPFCLEKIQNGAFICKHCARELEPEFNIFYRKVLEEKPELRNNSEKTREKLKQEVKKAYLLFVAEEKIRAEKLKRESDALEKSQNETYAQEQAIRDIRNLKIKKFVRRPIFQVGILALVIITVSITLNIQNYKDYKLVQSGGVIIDFNEMMGDYGLRTLITPNGDEKLFLNDNQDCTIRLKIEESDVTCSNILYQSNFDSVTYRIDFLFTMCPYDKNSLKRINGNISGYFLNSNLRTPNFRYPQYILNRTC